MTKATVTFQCLLFTYAYIHDINAVLHCVWVNLGQVSSLCSYLVFIGLVFRESSELLLKVSKQGIGEHFCYFLMNFAVKYTLMELLCVCQHTQRQRHTPSRMHAV